MAGLFEVGDNTTEESHEPRPSQGDTNGSGERPDNPTGRLMDPDMIAAIAQRGTRDIGNVLASLLRARPAGRPSSEPTFGARPASSDDDAASRPGPASEATTERPPIADALRTIDIYADAAKLFVEQYYSPPAAEAADSRLITVRACPGAQATAEWWLANLSTAESGAVQPRCSPPMSPSGEALGLQPEMTPAVIESLPARTSRGIRIDITIPDDASPAVYRAMLQATCLPTAWAVLEVVVTAER